MIVCRWRTVRLLPSRRRVADAALAALAVLSGLAACGVPLEDRAQVIPGEDLPYDLEGPPATEPQQPAGGVPAVVFLLRDDELVEAPRVVTEPADLNGLLDELTSPLTPAETAQGLRRALTDSSLLDGATRTANLATVGVDETFEELAPHEQVLALGQIVFTLTERDEVDRVQFSREGEPLTIPTATGSLVDRPVSRYDYRSLR